MSIKPLSGFSFADMYTDLDQCENLDYFAKSISSSGLTFTKINCYTWGYKSRLQNRYKLIIITKDQMIAALTKSVDRVFFDSKDVFIFNKGRHVIPKVVDAFVCESNSFTQLVQYCNLSLPFRVQVYKHVPEYINELKAMESLKVFFDDKAQVEFLSFVSQLRSKCNKSQKFKLKRMMAMFEIRKRAIVGLVKDLESFLGVLRAKEELSASVRRVRFRAASTIIGVDREHGFQVEGRLTPSVHSAFTNINVPQRYNCSL
ncbi:MAG: hypothetical protein P0S95_01625 [Rhabdochlamydiaceae bacterium]|nr:hypothetical protein [Candidatus Amphrikana amoebophyrae]